jgi:tetratricopeptide (TPR) repeat protein
VDDLPLGKLPYTVAEELEAGARLWRTGAFDAAQLKLETALERASALGSVPGQLSALHLMGNLAIDKGDMLTARTLHELVLSECRRLGMGVGMASSLHNLGLLAAREGNSAGARDQIIKAINLYEQIGRPDAAARARQNLRLIIAGERAEP